MLEEDYRVVTCRYVQKVENTARAICDFNGFPMNLGFPVSVMEEADIKAGDEFKWTHRPGKNIVALDLKKIDYNRPLTEEEEKELKEFVDSGRPLEDFLDKE